VFKNWNTNVKLVFLNSISDRIKEVTDNIYVILRDILKLHGNYNSEVKNLWYQLSLNLKKEDVIEFVEEFLSQIGRMKYIRPIYKAYGLLNKKLAINCFEKNK
jgi:leukotriene-A4 hydrolase